uniref:Putative ovule protein n=1 Tax=Solanum chacoense TaxID=4108 RepID=A0A0V0ID99_SOLCH
MSTNHSFEFNPANYPAKQTERKSNLLTETKPISKTRKCKHAVMNHHQIPEPVNKALGIVHQNFQNKRRESSKLTNEQRSKLYAYTNTSTITKMPKAQNQVPPSKHSVQSKKSSKKE